MLAYICGKFLAFKVNTNGWFLDEALSMPSWRLTSTTLVVSAEATMLRLCQAAGARQAGNIVKNVQRFHDIRKEHYPNVHTLLRISGSSRGHA